MQLPPPPPYNNNEVWNSIDQNIPSPPLDSNFLNSYPPCPKNDPFKNKQLVLAAYFGLANNPKKVEELFHPDYIQHNPGISDGRDAVINDPDPIQEVEFLKTSMEGEMVWTLSRLKVSNQSYIAADIFRVECGRIKEHWDVLEMEEEQNKNNYKNNSK